MKAINEMTKAELLNEVSRLNELHDSNQSIIAELTIKLESSSKDGRKSQVLSLLREYETISILEIASKLNISTKNVSSQLTYLRSDGYQIFTDPNGRKCLFESSKDDDQIINTDHDLNEDDSTTEVESTTEDEVKLEDTL
jgi:biotin operon repressor